MLHLTSKYEFIDILQVSNICDKSISLGDCLTLALKRIKMQL